jgi:hypothetical protein
MLPIMIVHRAGAGEGGVGVQVREGLGGPLHVPTAGESFFSTLKQAVYDVDLILQGMHSKSH